MTICGGFYILVCMGKLSERVSKEAHEMKKKVRERIFTYVGAGLGFVAGLAWNEAIISLINAIFPSARNTVLAKFLYAGILTLVVVTAAMYIERLMREEEKKQP